MITKEKLIESGWKDSEKGVLEKKVILSDKIEHCSPHAPMSEDTIEIVNKIAEQAYKTIK